MDIASLSERITIERNTPVMDDAGNHVNRWLHHYSCYAQAAASTYQQREQEKAGVIVGEDNLVFTVRDCRELRELDSTHYRVVFRGANYNITSVDMMNYGHKTIKISCSKERRRRDVGHEGQHRRDGVGHQ